MNITIKNLHHQDINLGSSVVEAFEASLRGELLRADHPDYDEARQVWNAMIDKRPALIVRCSGPADVISAVSFAGEHDLLLSCKGGGHNIAGSAVCEGGLMIDLGLLRGVTVDVKNKTATVQGGALLGDVDHETQRFGLAVTLGINSTTGVAGLALGGGYGWMSRAYGHTVDNMISADIVTANGDFLTVSAEENSDLFWAIRGGSGNFGIVTRFTFKLHAIGPEILSGPVIYPLEEAASVLRKYRELAKDMPDEASCWFVLRKAPPFPFLEEKDHGRAVLIFAMFYAGSIKAGEKALAPLRKLGTVLGDGVGPNPYCGWQAAFDPLVAPRARNYWKSCDYEELSDQVIDLMVSAASAVPTDECEIFVAQLGGAAGRIAEDAMAYPHRKTKFTMNIHGRWQTQDMDETCLGWVRGLYGAAEKHSRGSVYVNFVPENGEVRKIGAYGDNQGRLEKLKGQYDPKNLFQTNINIKGKP